MSNVSFKDWEKVNTQNQVCWRNYKLQVNQLVSPSSTTYLLEAAFTGNIAFINLYLSYNGDINVIDKKNRNVLHFTAMNDHHEVTRILCQYNINLNTTDSNGQSPIFYAISYRAYKSLRILIENNAELNLQDNSGDSIIHLSVRNSNIKLINFLSSKGASVLLKNKAGKYPIDIASETNNTELMQYLAKLGNYMKFNELISKKNNMIFYSKDKENKTILDFELNADISNEKSYKTNALTNLISSTNKASKKSSINIDSINFESRNINSNIESNNSVILREEKSYRSKGVKIKEDSYSKEQKSPKNLKKKKKRKTKESIVSHYLDLLWSQAKKIFYNSLSSLKNSLGVVGNKLKDGSLVAKDKLLIYGGVMKNSIGSLLEVKIKL